MQSHEMRTVPPEESEVLPSEAPEISKVAEEIKCVRNSDLPCDTTIEGSLASRQHNDESHDLASSKVRIADNRAEISHSSPEHEDSKYAHTTVSHFFIFYVDL